MTTLAYRAGVLACDSRMTGSAAVLSQQAVKIAKAGPFLFAGCGSWPLVNRFLEWGRGGCKGDMPALLAPLTGDEAADAGGFIFMPDGLIIVCTAIGMAPRVCEYFADGSGRDFAFGAMAAGASAEEAVAAAVLHDIYSGGGIQVLTHG